MELKELSAYTLREMILNRQITVSEVVHYYLDRIKKNDDKINAFLTITEDYAIKKAEELDKRIKNNEPIGKLAGLPIAIKDNICTKFAPTTCASRILENYIPPYNAHVIDELEKQDAIIIGKTNMDEFAMGSSTENSGFKITRNPWNPDCVPGGSSGGSAAAVASRLTPLALGSDTGGSIRQPAGFCNVFGLKPTYGLISRFGLVAFGSSLDQIGVFAPNIEDIALILNVISTPDPKDSTSIPENIFQRPDYTNEIKKTSNNIKIGIPKEYYQTDGLDEDVKNTLENTIEIFKSMDIEIIEISLPHTEYAVACYYLIATAEASSNLARYDGVHYGYRTPNPKDYIDVYISSRSEGFGDEVKRRIMLGTYALSSGYYDAYYLKALKVRTLIKQDFENAFKTVDIILAPIAPTPAFRIGEQIDDPLKMYLGDIFTIPVNLAGLPAISIPAGFSKNGLPIGAQLIGKHLNEAMILKSAKLFQANTDFWKKYPQGES